MGVSHSVYIGPALMVPKRTGPIDRDVRVDETGKETNNKFDPSTGRENKIITKTEVITQEPDAWIDEDSELNEDEFWSPEYCGDKNTNIFLCNSGSYNIDSDDGGGWQSISKLNIPAVLLVFKIKYKKYIEYYENKYGPIKIDYIAIGYWS